MLLALKLFLVPFFLGVISLAGKRWGPGFAGWLAGLPVVVGPILFLLAMERGESYARDAAVYTLGAVLPVIVFGVAYAWSCRRMRWPGAVLCAYGAWLAIALLVLALPLTIAAAACQALLALLLAPWVFPRVAMSPSPAKLPHLELALRMLAGAALTLAVTQLSASTTPAISGLLALFPVLSAILAIFTHRNGGADAAIVLLSRLATGLYSLAAFCFVLPLMLEMVSVMAAFMCSIAAAIVVQSLFWFFDAVLSVGEVRRLTPGRPRNRLPHPQKISGRRKWEPPIRVLMRTSPSRHRLRSRS